MIMYFPRRSGLAPAGETPHLNSRHPAAEKVVLHKRDVPRYCGAIWQIPGAVNGGEKDGYGSRKIFNFVEMLAVCALAGAAIYGGIMRLRQPLDLDRHRASR